MSGVGWLCLLLGEILPRKVHEPLQVLVRPLHKLGPAEGGPNLAGGTKGRKAGEGVNSAHGDSQDSGFRIRVIGGPLLSIRRERKPTWQGDELSDD